MKRNGSPRSSRPPSVLDRGLRLAAAQQAAEKKAAAEKAAREEATQKAAEEKAQKAAEEKAAREEAARKAAEEKTRLLSLCDVPSDRWVCQLSLASLLASPVWLQCPSFQPVDVVEERARVLTTVAPKPH